jgi:hypothetical protein
MNIVDIRVEIYDNVHQIYKNVYLIKDRVGYYEYLDCTNVHPFIRSI